MKNFKKVLAVVLSVLFVVPAMAFGASAADAVDVNSDWAAFGSGQISTFDGSTMSVLVGDATANNNVLGIYAKNPSVLNEYAYTFQAVGYDVDEDGIDDYPGQISFGWTTYPSAHVGMDNFSGDARVPFGINFVDRDTHKELAMILTLVDYLSLDLGWTIYTPAGQTAGNQTAEIAVWRIISDGWEWNTQVIALDTPVDLTQPINVSAFNYYDDGEEARYVGAWINDNFVAIPGCGDAFVNDDDGTLLNGENAMFYAFAGASCIPAYLDSTPLGLASIQLTEANPNTADGHNCQFANWTTTTAPTCIVRGEETGTCTICGATTTRILDLVDHTWDNGVVTRQASCNKTEKTTYTCTVCGLTREETTGEKLPHIYYDIDDPRNVAPTCTEPGIQVQQCDQRSPSHTKEVTIPALGHNVETWTQVSAGDCITPSVEEGLCTRCQQIVQRQGEVAGHNYVVNGVHEGKLYETCSVCGDVKETTLGASGLTDASSYGDGMLQDDYWTVDVDNKVGDNMGIGSGYNDWVFAKTNDNGNLYVLDTNFAFQDYPATAAANTRVVSKFATTLDGFTAEITPMPAWIDASASLKFPWAQNYSFFWTNNPEAYRDASTGTTSRGFIKDGSNYAADDRSLEVVFADAVGYDGVADTLIVTATFNGTAYPFTYSINVPFYGEASGEAKRPNLGNPLTVEVINTASEFAVIAQGQRYDFNDMIGVITGDVYFGAQASTDWTMNSAVRALSTDFEISEINGEANTATWAGTELPHQWTAWTAGSQQLTRTCTLCGETETQNYDKDYILTFDPAGGKIDGEDYLYFGINYGESYGSATGWTYLHTPVREGYVFQYWDYNGLGGVYGMSSDRALNDTYGVQENASFVAVYRARRAYDLTFDANGGTIDGEASVTFDIDYGMTYADATGWDSIHVPVREGYYFDGWNYAGVYTLGNLNDQYGLQSDGTFVAQWREITSYYIDTTNHGFTNNPQFVGSVFDTSGLSPSGNRLTMYYGFASGDPVKVGTRTVSQLQYFLEDGTELVRNETVLSSDMVGEHTITIVPKSEDYAAFSGTVTLTIADTAIDGLSLTVHADETAKHVIVISGEYDTYKDIKAAKASEAYYYGVEASTLAGENYIHTFALPDGGTYTICIRHTDGTDTFETVEAVAPVIPEPVVPEFDVSVVGTTVTFATEGNVKILRYAAGAGITTMGDIKAADGVLGFTGARFVDGEFVKTIAPATYSYVVEFTDGTQTYGEFTTELIVNMPTFEADRVYNIGSEIQVIRYMAGDQSALTMAQAKAAGAAVISKAYVNDGTYTFKRALDGEYTFFVQYAVDGRSFFKAIVVDLSEEELVAPAVVEEASAEELAEINNSGEIIGFTSGDAVELDTVVSFATTQTLAEAEANEVADWDVDFILSFDKDVDGDKVGLWGNYGEYGWVGDLLSGAGITTLEAGDEIGVISDWFAPFLAENFSSNFNGLTYADVIDSVGNFVCGLYADESLAGTVATLKLVVSNGSESIVANTYTYIIG